MALPVWPATLPQLRGLVESGGTDALYRGPKVTEFDDGPLRARRRGIFSSTTLSMTIYLNLTTLPIFQTFVIDTLGDGTSRFTGPVLLPNGTVATKTCRITTTASLRWLGGISPVVSFPLTVWGWR